MRLLFVDDFFGPDAWLEVGGFLRHFQCEYFVPAQTRTLDPGVIAVRTRDKLKADFENRYFDIVVAAGNASAPAAQVALCGLAPITVLFDPPLSPLAQLVPAVKRHLEQLPLDDLLDEVDTAVERVGDDAGGLLEVVLGPRVGTARERRFLELSKQIMAQRMPFDESLTGSAGEDGRRAVDWLIPVAEAPRSIQLILSRPAPPVVEGIRGLVPAAQISVHDWPKQMWIQDPPAVGSILKSLIYSRN